MNTQIISLEDHSNLLNELQILLEKQIKMAQNSNLGEVERIAGQSNTLIKKLSEIKAPQDQTLRDKYQNVLRSYKKLQLMIETEKDAINQELTKISKGKKTIRAYQG